MNYEIHIKDMENPDDVLILEHAERNSIVLNTIGGDDKTQPILGRELLFTMEVLDGTDGKYIQYFTSNEQKWEVTKIISHEQETPELAAQGGQIIWRGYILPESYSEPWENPTFYPQFSAVDGLGLLKGKQLSPDFYSEEKSVIEVITACLKLTGIDFPLYFSPAIENHVQKHWHEIFVDTRKWYDEKKLPSAYEILHDHIFSLRSQLFQSKGRWMVEGINKRQLPTVSFFVYNLEGEYLGTQDVTKAIKKVEWYPTPMITMVAPLREVIVRHESGDVDLREDIYREQQIDWKPASGVTLEIFPADWDYGPDYLPVMKAPDYYLELPVNKQTEFQEFAHVRLKEKIYVLKDVPVKITIGFQAIGVVNHVGNGYEYPEGFLESSPLFEVRLNGFLKISSLWSRNAYPGVVAKYNSDFAATVSFEYTPNENGYLDLRIYSPYDLPEDTSYSAIRVTNLQISIPSIEQEDTYTVEVEPQSSQVREIDLPISDDINGFSKSFYLDRQRDFSDTESFKIAVPILYSFPQNGNNYHVVSLKHAHLIEQFINYVHWTNPYSYLKNLEVIYNLNGGEQMVVKADALMTGTWYVSVRSYEQPVGDRMAWLKWTDAVYINEQKPYAQVVAEIEQRLFSNPHMRIEATAAAPVDIDDLIEFRYRGEDKYFVPTNISWNPDVNESTITLVEGVYAGNSLGNIPPYVDAGPDIYIGASETTAQITEAVANDPNGSIASLIWEQLSGDPGATYSSPAVLNPLISNITGSISQFRLTAIDNEGASASDTMRVIRVGDYILTMEEISVEENMSSMPIKTATWITKTSTYELKIDPELPLNETVSLTFNSRLYRNLNNIVRSNVYSGRVLITKNGSEVYDFYRNNMNGPRSKELTDESNGDTINFIHSDKIIVQLTSTLVVEMGATTDEVSAEISFVGSNFLQQSAQISNLPVGEKVHVKYTDYV